MDRRELPSNRYEARRIARMAKSFTLVDGELYKRAAAGVLQRCVPIPRGVSSFETSIRACAATMRRLAPSWATHSARASIGPPRSLMPARSCAPVKGAIYARKTNLPAHALQTIPVTWPFALWGLDIVGPLRKAPGGYTHLLVVINKFSRWVEVRPITNLRAEQAVTFFTDIIYRFGVPNSIITDNGSQFTSRKFLEFCDKFHIRVDWAAVAHP
jgi:transposase InsO family protein